MADTSEQTNTSRRRRFMPGPATIIAMLIAAYLLVTNRESPRMPPEPPRSSDRAKIVLTPEQKLGPIPDVAYLLENSKALTLTPNQIRELKMLSDKQQAELKPLMAKAQLAGEDLGGMLKTSKNTRDVEELSAAGGEYKRLSQLVGDIRKAYWTQASKRLSEMQNEMVNRQREVDFTRAINRLGY